MTRSGRPLLLALSGVVLGLLAVGIVSGTPLRHTVQVLPAVLAMIAVWRERPWAAPAAAPIFAFWLTIMVFIWLFLLGIAKILRGHFTRAEIVLTVVIGIACIAGIAACARPWRSAGSLQRMLAFFLSFALQIAAMWLSTRQGLSSR